MRTVAQVADPCLQSGRIVLLHNAAIGLDGGMSRDRGPFTTVVDEADVDGRVCLKVIGLAGFSVGVEEKIEAVALLRSS